MTTIIIILVIIWVVSSFCAMPYISERVDYFDILAIFALVCPILNTVLAIKGAKENETFSNLFGKD